MRRMLAGSESTLHEQVCQYLRTRYPDVLFRSDMAGVRLTMSQAVASRRTQQGRAWPDLLIAEPKWKKDGGPVISIEGNVTCAGTPMKFWAGLFLELKREGTKLYLKDGVTLVSDPHVREQAEVLEKLRSKGYKAEFAVGFDEAKKVIDGYLS